MKKIAKIVVNSLTIIVFCILVLVIIAKAKMLVSGSDCFQLFGYSFFNVVTGSMKPAINENDIVIVKKSDKYLVDDIITFKKDDSYITHRIVMINDDNLITKGDANNTNDLAIKEDMVLGKVIKILPKAGIWQKTLISPKVIIAVFITLLAFDFVFSYKGKKDEKGNEKKVKEDSNDTNRVAIDINKLSDEELKEIIDKINSKPSKKEIENLEYTIGLDLTTIQEEIKAKLDGSK